MTRLTILQHPDPRLRTRAAPVTQIDGSLRRLIDDMLETMYATRSIGLAATQVDVHLRVLVVDVSADQSAPLVFVNPELMPQRRGEQVRCLVEERCLSLPGVAETVNRLLRVRVSALDRHGAAFTSDAEGLLAVCLQHEIDHLDGKLFIDALSWWKRMRLRGKLEKGIHAT